MWMFITYVVLILSIADKPPLQHVHRRACRNIKTTAFVEETRYRVYRRHSSIVNDTLCDVDWLYRTCGR